MNADERRLNAVTERIIASLYAVSNGLGAGFLERVYENAFAVELRHAGIRFAQQQRLVVHYRSEVVGEYIADFIVEDAIIVELKAVKAFEDIHTAQCLNYLRATGLKICLLVNMAKPRIEIKRIVHNL